MDAQPSLQRAVGLVALVQGLARYSVENPVQVDLPGHVVAANDFRAARYGLDASVVDPDGRVRPMRDVALDAVALARSALAESGNGPLDEVEAYLYAEPEYSRQRRIREEHGMSGLLIDLVERTVAEDHRSRSRAV